MFCLWIYHCVYPPRDRYFLAIMNKMSGNKIFSLWFIWPQVFIPLGWLLRSRVVGQSLQHIHLLSTCWGFRAAASVHINCETGGLQCSPFTRAWPDTRRHTHTEHVYDTYVMAHTHTEHVYNTHVMAHTHRACLCYIRDGTHT